MKRKRTQVRLKGKLRSYVLAFIYLGILLLAVNVLIYLFDTRSGLVLSGYVVLYFVLAFTLYGYNKNAIAKELVSFATHYGQVQKALLQELEIPYAVLDDEGHIIWMNGWFERITHKEHNYRRSITSIFPSVTREKLPGDEEYVESELDYEDSSYLVKMRKIPVKDMINNSSMVEANGNYEGYLVAFYLFDNTAVKLALQEIEDQSLVVGMIYLDNYEEALESVEEVRRSLLIALIDRKVNKYISAIDGICKKLEKDKYLIVLRKKALDILRENRFDILDDVKTVNIGNEMAITISIGIGLSGLTYAQNYEFARNAIDLALGRGGDQAVVKTPENVVYYGGKSQQAEKNTKVKARVKAQALQEIISAKEQVLVMGHRNPDVDSFGASVGIYRIAKALDKEAHIVLNDVTPAIKPMVELFADKEDYDDAIIRNQEAMELADNGTVLVVVDVNKPSITECPELLKACKSIVVLDHHRQSTESIDNATLSYVEAYASSACEMISEIIQYIDGGVRISAEEADCMYSGIMIDTNNFLTKTGVRTFEAAAFLRRSGADVTRVRKLFREDASEYKARADAVSQAEIYRNAFAISTCPGEDVESPTVVGAQAANELLNIKGVMASFVLTQFQNQVYISARSIDEINVQIIMERMGGGGHLNVAGAQLEGVSLEAGIGALKETLDKMIEEKELKI
ncbi:MAG: DHH family phosphoesterase [Lachnospiraceae bacterium]|nr:DHH family phosphoesterase [Lachnospiraceae bacterium]